MNDDDQAIPELPDDRTATGSEIDRRLKWHDREQREIRNDLERVRASIQASLEGDHERATTILDGDE